MAINSISCSTVNDLFQRETGRFSVDIQERYSVESPWGRLTRVGKFPLGMGTTLRELTVERVLSGSFESNWASVGTGNAWNSTVSGASAGCIPNPTNLSFGQSYVTWNLQTQTYQTPCICLDDLKTSFEIERQVGKTVEQLTQLTRTVLDNRRRSEYLRLVPKMVAGSYTEYNSYGSNSIGTVAGDNWLNYANAGSALPQAAIQLNQNFLDVIRVGLIRDGAGHNPLGRENGAAVLGLITSAETSRQLLRNDDALRQDIRYATPSELVAPLGVDRSYGGYYHLVDFEVPRYTFSGGTYTQVYPFVQVAATSGYRWVPNLAYEQAPYEAAYIFHPDVYEEAVQQVGPNIPGAPFDDYPYYYSGQFFWLNIRNADNNPLGKIGRWLAVFQSGSRPLQPWLGRVVIHKRCFGDISGLTGIGCTTTVAGDSNNSTLTSTAEYTSFANSSPTLTPANATYLSTNTLVGTGVGL